MVKDGNFTLLQTSSGQEWQMADQPAGLPPTLTCSGPEWQIHIATEI